MRIVMFGHKHMPNGMGGVEVVVEELAVRLVQKGHAVTCLNRTLPDTQNVSSHKGVRIKRVLTIQKRGLGAVSASFFATLRAAFGRYDVVHIHAEGPAFLCWLPKLSGKRVIVTIHGLDHQRAKWGRFARWFILRGEKNAVRFADAVIVLNHHTQTYFKEKYGRETVYIPNGLTAHKRCAPKRITEKWGLHPDTYILSLGRLVPEKGLECLIRAFLTLETDKQLVIAGNSSDTDAFVEHLHELAAQDPRIRFIGWVKGEEKAEIFSNAYFYVLPSTLEGMPISLLEAISYGCCCLTSDIPECAEVIEDNGVLFRVGDEKDLREKMDRLCRSAQLVVKYKAMAETVQQNKYSWDTVAEQTAQLYKRKV